MNATPLMNGSAPTPSRFDRERASSRAQLERVIQANVDGMAVVDQEGVVRYSNPAALAVFGLSSGQRLGSVFGIASVEEDGAEVDIPAGDGRRLVAEIRSAALLWDGEPCRLLSIRDITAHKELEEALSRAREQLRVKVADQKRKLVETVDELHRQVDHRHQTERDLLESEERFRLAFEHGSVGKVIVDAEERIVQVNRAVAQMLDTTHQELLGRTFRELACPEDAEPERTFAQQLLDGDIPQYTIEKQFQNESGDVIVCRVTSNVISRRDGRPVYVLKLLENVTQQRRVQEMVRRQERLAAIGTLAAGIAHEINSPAGAALLSAETALTLLDRPGSEKDVRTCLENIVIASQRCGEIIRNTLRFSQDHKSEKALRDLNDVIRIAADLPRMIVDRTRSRVELQLEGDLPKVSINELELELIVVNLIKNALQANSRPVLVVIQTRRVDDRVEMVVADNGTGMSAYQQSRAFDPFYTTRRSAGGTGLGLSIVHGIVQDHGGTIEIESKLGEGAVFRILLPIRDTDDRQP